jgi:hypothetical protein
LERSYESQAMDFKIIDSLWEKALFVDSIVEDPQNHMAKAMS